MSSLLERDILNISCLHEREGVSTDIEVPDYSPLSPGELADLMVIATDSTDFRLRNSIHCRLAKAIPGMVCPRPIEGDIADRSTLINHLYMDEITHGRTEGFIERFFHIIGASPEEIERLFDSIQ